MRKNVNFAEGAVLLSSRCRVWCRRGCPEASHQAKLYSRLLYSCNRSTVYYVELYLDHLLRTCTEVRHASSHLCCAQAPADASAHGFIFSEAKGYRSVPCRVLPASQSSVGCRRSKSTPHTRSQDLIFFLFGEHQECPPLSLTSVSVGRTRRREAFVSAFVSQILY